LGPHVEPEVVNLKGFGPLAIFWPTKLQGGSDGRRPEAREPHEVRLALVGLCCLDRRYVGCLCRI